MFENMNQFDVAIIGGGPVGIFSIFACGLNGLSCAIIDANSELGGQCKNIYPEKSIYDVPGFSKIKGLDLVDQLVNQANIFNPYIMLNEFVLSIEKNDKNIFEIKTKTNKIIRAKSVIIALGVGAFFSIKLSIPYPKELEGIKIFYDFTNIENYKDKVIGILGGGDTALDYALEFSKVAKKVVVIHRREVFKGHISSYNNVKAISNIELRTNAILRSISESSSNLVLYFDNNTSMKCDYLFPCYGISSNISFIEKWDLNLKENKIEVNENMQTSKEGVFAVGDCVYVKDRSNLLITGFAEAVKASRGIFQYLYPTKALDSSFSTNMMVFKDI